MEQQNTLLFGDAFDDSTQLGLISGHGLGTDIPELASGGIFMLTDFGFIFGQTPFTIVTVSCRGSGVG